MAEPRILRIQIVDSNAFVVVKTESNGPRELDLTLVGTDEDAPFIGQMTHAGHQKMRSPSADVLAADWTRILLHLLAPGKHGHRTASSDNVELVANMTDTSMILIMRKNVQGITQRLGEMELSRDDNVEIRLFEWAALAAASSDSLATAILECRATSARHEQTIVELQTLLNDLVKAKTEHEDELLERFALLLNSKKLKIRDQQRLLAHAKIEPTAASSLVDARQTTRGRSARGSAPLKRKASGQDNTSDSEARDLDADSQSETEDGVATPDASESSDLDDQLLRERPGPNARTQVRHQATQDSNYSASRGASAATSSQPTRGAAPASSLGDDDETDDEL